MSVGLQIFSKWSEDLFQMDWKLSKYKQGKQFLNLE